MQVEIELIHADYWNLQFPVLIDLGWLRTKATTNKANNLSHKWNQKIIILTNFPWLMQIFMNSISNCIK